MHGIATYSLFRPTRLRLGLRAVAALMMLACMPLVSSCDEDADAIGSSNSAAVGKTGVRFQFDGINQSETIAYVITRHGFPPLEGKITMEGQAEVGIMLSNLPTGGEYFMSATATGSRSNLVCEGEAAWMVQPGMVTSVTVAMPCAPEPLE